MAGKLLLVNPAKRKKPRTAAQKAATRRLVALNRKSTVKAPAKRRRASSVITVKSNPMKRRKRLAATGINAKNLVKSAVVPSVIASAGALGLDVLMGYANRYLPANLQTGVGGTIAKFGGAVALGMAVEKFKNKELGKQVMIGGMTVTLHELMKVTLQASAPQIPLAGVGVYDGLGLYDKNLNGWNGIESQDLGFYSPATVAGLGANGTVSYYQAYEEYDEKGNLVAS